MSCPDCKAASERDHWAFLVDCVGCKARSVARGPDFARVRKAGSLDRQYRALLVQMGLSHAEVKAAAAVDFAAKATCS